MNAISYDDIGVAPPIAKEGANLAVLAIRFAGLPADQAERLIEGYVIQAVTQWRVTDATFWHRVKFRSRMLRACGAGRVALAGEDPARS